MKTWNRLPAGCALIALISFTFQCWSQTIYTPYAFTNFAGQPGGPGSADETGRGARFHSPSGTAVDGAGNVYVADDNNFTIRKITPAGVVTTIAGTALQTGTNDNIGSAARFGSVYGGPMGIAVDSQTNLYVADTGNDTIRKLTLVGTNWSVTTLAGTGGQSGTNDATGRAARFYSPTSIALDHAGNLYVTDGYAVRQVTPAGVVTTLAGSGNQYGTLDGTNGAARFGSILGSPRGIAVDGQTNIYVTDTFNNTLRKISPVGNNWVVSTAAGVAGLVGFSNGTNNGALFSNPFGAALDPSGNLFVSEYAAETIRKIVFSGTNAIVSTIAGGVAAFGNVDGLNDLARFQTPEGMSADGGGNLYVADFGNQEIRKITPSGTNWVVTTLAGQGGGPGVLDGTGNAAQFDLPNGLAIDTASNLYVGDTFNHTIRKVTPAGVVTTIAGSPGNKGYGDGVGTAESPQFNSPLAVALDGQGNMYVADSANNTIRKITSAGVTTTFAGQAGVTGSANLTGTNATFNSPNSVAVDTNSGNVYVSDLVNRTIRKITPAGVVSTFAGSTGQQGTNDGVGTAAKFTSPAGLAVDSSGDVYVADQGGDTIRKITPGGSVSTFAGLGKSNGTNDGVGNLARFNAPQGVAIDAAGNVYVADSGNQIVRMITPGGSVTTLAGLATQSGTADGTNRVARFSVPRGIAVDASGTIYVSDVNSSTIRKLVISGTNCIVTTFAGTAGQNGSVDAQGLSARFHSVFGLAADASGNLYAADRYNDIIRKVTPDGTVTTFAGLTGTAGSTDGAGGGAQFYGPEDLTVDGAGNIYVVEFFNNTVRKIAPNGTNWIVTTLAGCPTCAVGTNDGIGSLARFTNPFGLARDSLGNLYVADTSDRTIRKLVQTGTNWVVSTFVGAPLQAGDVDATGTAARLLDPHDIAVDSANNLFITDGEAIRKITPAGAVTTIASCPPPGCADALGAVDGLGSDARFNLPRGLTVDSAGNVYVSDSGNDTIRKLSFSGGNWTVTTLGGIPGQASGADGVGSGALFNQPNGIAVDAGGTLYVVNSYENSIVRGTPASAATPTLQFDASSGNLLVANGNFQVRLDGPSSGTVVLEASSNLTTWTPIQTDSFSGSPVTITVPLNVGPDRFFRAYLVP